jgi:predicted metallo-beta-lactamase superfamily hydrolase
MKQIIDGKRYDTDKACLVASDRYWDGSNFERHGRNTMLYKTAKGAFFLHHTTQWQGERERIENITEEEAKGWYERLPEYELDFAEAFGEEPEEA